MTQFLDWWSLRDSVSLTSWSNPSLWVQANDSKPPIGAKPRITRKISGGNRKEAAMTSLGQNLKINGDRLWESLMEMA
ncbi:hypothetical protein, partial [Pseudophaeobacter arcticus]|uniref:hypothetical protein n=1 Tax=Pseudophaeobacter arcticus TaxID=385492 RepID=UPI0039E6C8ED